jgi:hypothetical protein
MLNVKDTGKRTRSVRPLVQRSREEQLAMYAKGPGELDAVLAGLSEEDLDRARSGPWTIRQIVEHVVDDDARWTMCMQVALVRPGYTYGHEWLSSNSLGTWAGPSGGTEHGIAPVLTLFRTNRTHILARLHHLPATWDRYVTVASAADQDARTLTVGQMVYSQATHALEHIDEIRQACR